jgi:putative Holliday junction resolvase
VSRVLAIDFGERRIGLALSDESQRIALPHSTLPRDTSGGDVASIARLVERDGISTVVVGVPISLSGQDTVQTVLTRRWAEQLRRALPCPVILFDERLTTTQAHRALDDQGVKRRNHQERIDQVAATLLLQSYLERALFAREEQPSSALEDRS